MTTTGGFQEGYFGANGFHDNQTDVKQPWHFRNGSNSPLARSFAWWHFTLDGALGSDREK